MFKFLPHTADIRIRISGKTKEKIFIDSLRAINIYLKPVFFRPFIFKKFILKIEKSEKDIDNLIDFLNKILALVYIKKFIFEIEDIKINNKNIIFKLKGRKFKKIKRDIKSVTYHNVFFAKEKNFYIAEFVIDV
jgi:SHS2 domain-containing protein